MKSLARYGLAALPCVMLVLAPLFADSDEPRVLGLPFLLAWILFWVLLTPVIMFGVDRLRERT